MKFDHVKNYTCIAQRELKDIGSVGYVLRHDASGARVMLIENSDDNKVFNIAFRTTPADSTGVPHIIEHTVLCGSRKYPAKDPFVELVKGSMNTFLNAMTYPDKTMFPVASCNDRDFQNLMDVYLDAVFYPNIYRNEQIFRQEGWNYQIASPEDPVTLNGVVYNEMKGAFSSADDVLERRIMNSLFPDTTYGVESGGDPECIPDLTYEQFLDFHRKYYNPANAYLYLYGDMDFAERLDYLDREYLGPLSGAGDAASGMGPNGPVYSEVGVQKPFEKPVEEHTRYPVAEEDPLEDNTYLTWNVVVGESTDTRLANAFAALSYALLNAPGAPLKEALLDAGIGKDVYASYDSGIRQPVFSIVAKNANAKDEARMRAIVREQLERLCREGLNPKALEAAVNTMEFKYREADYGGFPKGLLYSINAFDSWLYRDDMPFDYLVQLDDYRFLRKQIGTGYFEDLVRTWILDNPHASYVTVEPERGLTQKMEEATRKKLQAFKASLSAEQVQELIGAGEKLRAFQETPSTQEELKKIPMLTRADLNPKARPFSNEAEVTGGVKLVRHEAATNGIAYLSLHLDLSGIKQEELPYVGILRHVLGEVDTEHYTYQALANEIGRRTGGVHTALTVFPDPDDAGKVKAALTVQIATLPSEIAFSCDIARELLFTSKLDSEKRLKEILQKQRSRLYAGLLSAGHVTALSRAMSGFNAEHLVLDAVGGMTHYRVLEDLEKHFDEKKSELIRTLEDLRARILVKDGFVVSYTGPADSLPAVREGVQKLHAQLAGDASSAGGSIRSMEGLSFAPRSEGFRTPAKVQYVAQAGSFKGEGLPYTGALSVLKVILSYEYLWNNVRVLGGAYGCGATFARNGSAAFYSYRDPHLRNTLQVYRNIVDYLKGFTVEERDMTKFVIGTISDMDAPLTPRMSGDRSMLALVCGITQERVQRERDQVLAAAQDDIRALAPYVEAVLAGAQLCVVGGEEKLGAAAELFERLETL